MRALLRPLWRPTLLRRVLGALLLAFALVAVALMALDFLQFKQEMAERPGVKTLADGIAYVQAAVDAGLDVDRFAPRLSFFFNAHSNFIEEIAKFRAARTLWSRIMRERFGATDPKSMALRFHAQTGGSTLTAQQPDNNVVRVALQVLSAALGGAQSIHANGYDEALALPTEQSAKLALRTQQVIAEETGITDSVDPMAGGWMVESLTAEIEQRADDLISRIDERGGAVDSIEFMRDEIADAAYRWHKAMESGERKVVGINIQAEPEETRIDILKIDPAVELAQGDPRHGPGVADDARRLDRNRDVADAAHYALPAKCGTHLLDRIDECDEARVFASLE